MNIQQSLEILGLSERESRVYQALLNIGATTTTKIIFSTGIPSSKIYDILERLEQKGLVTHILIRGKKEFHPANPKKLYDLIKEKQDTIEDILPKLNQLYEQKSQEIQAEIYKGKEGLKTIFEDIIKEKEDWINIGASGKGELTLPYYMSHFYEKTKKLKINSKILFIDSETTREQVKKLKKYPNFKIKFLPKSMKNLMSIFVYADKVVIIPITSTIELMPIAIMIKSKESADSYRDYFKWLWKIQK